MSLPGSPFQVRRNSRASQFGWRKKPTPGHSPRPSHDRQPLVLPYLDNVNFPYADESNAVTPTSDDLMTVGTGTHTLLAHRRRLSSTSYTSHRMSPHVVASSRGSFVSHHSRHSSHVGELGGFKERREPTVFMWNTSIKQQQQQQQQPNRAVPLLPEVIVDTDHVSVSCANRTVFCTASSYYSLDTTTTLSFMLIIMLLILCYTVLLQDFIPVVSMTNHCHNIILCTSSHKVIFDRNISIYLVCLLKHASYHYYSKAFL